MIQTRAATTAARFALVLIAAGAAGLIWVCASPESHEAYARLHPPPPVGGEPLREETYANPAR